VLKGSRIIRTRWCVLQQDCILYFASPNCNSLLQYLPLRNARIVTNLDNLPETYIKYVRNNLMFALLDNVHNRITCYRTVTSEQCNIWRDTIEQLINKIDPKGIDIRGYIRAGCPADYLPLELLLVTTNEAEANNAYKEFLATITET